MIVVLKKKTAGAEVEGDIYTLMVMAEETKEVATEKDGRCPSALPEVVQLVN